MNCRECGNEMKKKDQPCEHCGYVMTQSEDMDTVLKTIFSEEGGAVSVATQSKTSTGSVKQHPHNSKNRPVKNREGQGAKRKNKNAGERMVVILRMSLAGVMMLFSISVFLSWFDIGGTAAYVGIVQNADSVKFINSEVVGHGLDEPMTNDVSVMSLSGWDIYRFARKYAAGYEYVTALDGSLKTSLVSVIQKYYMLAMLLVVITSFIGTVLVLATKSLRWYGVIRNFGVLNAVIIGLNLMAMKVTWLNMFIINAKDYFKQNQESGQLSIVHNGITYEGSHYIYDVQLEKGVYIAFGLLLVWLILSIILVEIRGRREEKAIEQGDEVL